MLGATRSELTHYSHRNSGKGKEPLRAFRRTKGIVMTLGIDSDLIEVTTEFGKTTLKPPQRYAKIGETLASHRHPKRVPPGTTNRGSKTHQLR